MVKRTLNGRRKTIFKPSEKRSPRDVCYESVRKKRRLDDDIGNGLLGDPRHRAIVGSLIYVMTGTRPDLCYVVIKPSQNMSTLPNPVGRISTWASIVEVFERHTRTCLKFEKSESPLKVTGFCD